MDNLASLYHRLFTGQAGTRVQTEFEWSFGATKNELAGITGAPPHAVRILSQLAFAIELSGECGGEHDARIRAVLESLLESQRREGAITRAAAQAAEAQLMPLSAQAKAYEILCAAHAHIDMNWMWSYHETVACTLDTFRTMLALMEEYPDFTYSQSQASVYRIVEEFDPDMMDQIRARIREGRWEVTASTWVENDKNMPATESLARHNLYTKNYLQSTWGVSPDALTIDFSPDTFGHSRQIPEIDAQAGIKYYYHCRAFDGDDILYRWRAASGAELLVYREPYWYNSGITPAIGIGLIDVLRTYGMKTGLIVYGVGDHGGGPTRRDINQILEMDAWPIYPKVRFGTFAQFYAKAESVRQNLRVIDREINYFAPGCYTTQSRIKLGNRKSEGMLGDAEALAALAVQAGVKAPYRTKRFETAWRNVLFTHFHDIITGSCVRDTREHAMGLYQESLAIANTARADAMRAVAARIDTSSIALSGDIDGSQSQGAGVGYGIERFESPQSEQGMGLTRIFHVFNPSSMPRKGLVEVTVWDWPGDLRRARFTDGEGQAAAFQWIDRERQRYWDHRYCRLWLEADVPALGYATYVLTEDAPQSVEKHMNDLHKRSSYARDGEIVMENAHIRAVLSPGNGRILSLTDVHTGREYIQAPEGAGLEWIEEDPATSNAWEIGRYVNREPVAKNLRVTGIEVGRDRLRQQVTLEGEIRGHSTAKATISLSRDGMRIEMAWEIDWHEVGFPGGRVPMIRYAVPVGDAARRFIYDIPGGTQAREPRPGDVPGNSYGAADFGDGTALQLIADSKYGFRGMDGVLSVTLIHSANAPDPYPERGIHHIRLAIGVGSSCPVSLAEASHAFCHPFGVISAMPHAGDLAMRGSLMAMTGKALISGIKRTEDGSGTLVRLYDVSGADGEVELRFPGEVKRAYMADTLENRREALDVVDGRVRFALGAHALRAVIVE